MRIYNLGWAEALELFVEGPGLRVAVAGFVDHDAVEYLAQVERVKVGQTLPSDLDFLVEGVGPNDIVAIRDGECVRHFVAPTPTFWETLSGDATMERQRFLREVAVELQQLVSGASESGEAKPLGSPPATGCPFAFFGLTAETATPKDVRAAHRAYIRRCHPDHLGQLLPSLQELGNYETQRANAARDEALRLLAEK